MVYIASCILNVDRYKNNEQWLNDINAKVQLLETGSNRNCDGVKQNSAICLILVTECLETSAIKSWSFSCNDNEEEFNTIKRDVYIQWRVGGIKF